MDFRVNQYSFEVEVAIIENVSAKSITISQLLTAVLTVVAVVVMMLTISPLLAAITMLSVPLLLWVTRTITRRS